MPNPQTSSQYPSQWLQLIQQVGLEHKTVTVRSVGGEPLDKRQATRLRFRFYSFRAALHRDTGQSDMAAIADSVEARLVEQEGRYAVIFAPRDKNAEAGALEEAMQCRNEP